ncbi:hypothetical protein [Shewanella baltica]|uniref:hypothetical protein n=1 Tax=Shewanella baltica TaxID=62322 RepID=UPI0039AF6E69
MRHFIFGCSTLLCLCSCSSLNYDETYIGSTEYYYRSIGTDKFTTSQQYAPIVAQCFNKDDIIDIRLDSFGLSADIDGTLEDITDGSILNPKLKNRNEIAVFVTIKEMLNDSNEKNVNLDKRLIFTSSSLDVGVKANVINKLIYSHVYNGNDLEFSIEVLELDQEQGEAAIQLLGEISKFSTNPLIINNPISAEMLNAIGKSAASKYFRNDVVSRLNLQLVPCGTYESEQLYLQQGQIAFVRKEQKGLKDTRYKELRWSKDEYRPVSGDNNSQGVERYPSYFAFSLLKRYSSLDKKIYITEKSVGNSSSEEIEKELVLIEEQKEVLSNMRKVIDIRESELKNKILPKSDFLENKK